MKTFALMLSLSMLLSSTASCQPKSSSQSNNGFAEFINSFPRPKSSDILNFRITALEIWDKSSMNIPHEHALKYVYNNDTTMLHCTSKTFSQETEEVFSLSREENIPKKCFRVNYENYQLVAYYYGLCQNPDSMPYSIIELLLVDKYAVRDSIIVYKDNDYYSEVTGLLNPSNGKVFIISIGTGYMYKVNEKTLKFEVVKEGEAKFDTDDYMKALELFGWKELFME
jgi:hypothetical protein